jgi:hypothetical protein
MRALWSAVVLAAATSACGASSSVDARVQAIAASEASLDTYNDYELGEIGRASELAELEALYAQSNDDSRLLALLARAWCRVSFEFILDEYERSLEQGDHGLAAYHLTRARGAYERAMYYADTLLEHRADGFQSAARRSATLESFLEQHVTAKGAAEALLWAGFARVGYADASPEAMDAAEARRAGELLLRRSLSLAPALLGGLAHLLLGASAAHASPPDLKTAESELQAAEQTASGKRLLAFVVRARTVDCLRHDRGAFERDLERVLDASDPSPSLRLENVTAKRRARRYLTSRALTAECWPAATSR